MKIASIEAYDKLFLGISIWNLDGSCIGTHITKNPFRIESTSKLSVNLVIEKDPLFEILT